MADINKEDVLPDDLIQAPLILKKNFEGALETVKLFISTAKDFTKAMSDGTKTVGDHKEGTKKLTEEQRLLAQIQKQIAVETAKQSAAYQEQVSILSNLKNQTKAIAADQELTKNFQAQYASITELTKALSSNRAAYANLRGDSERNSAAGKKLLQTIQDQDKALSKLTQTGAIARRGNEEFRQGVEKLGGSLGEVGEKGVAAFKAIGAAASSGWGLVVAATGLGTFALKSFFERSEEGLVKFETMTLEVETRWSIFKNRIAAATEEVLKFAEADQSYKDYKEGQKVARMSPEQLAEYNKQKAFEAEIKDLVLSRKKVEEEEIPLIVKRISNLDRAAKLEVEARESSTRGVKERLADIIEAHNLYNSVQAKDIEFATKKAGLVNQEIYLRAQGRELLNSEKEAIERNIASVVQLQLEFDKASRRRVMLMQTLIKESKEQPMEVGLDKEFDEMLQAIEKRNEKEVAENKKKNDQEDADNKAFEKEQNAIADQMFEREYEDANKSTDKIIDKIHERQEKERLANEKRIELAKTIGDTIVSTVENQFNAQIAAHQAYLNQTRENYQEEMQMASGNKIAQAQLTAKFREQEKIEQRKMLELRRKEAEFDKEAAEFTIVVKTAEAVAKDVAKYPETGGEPFAALDVAIGALQLAAIAAKPLPSYQFGTKDHVGGKAKVGEVGFELYKEPSGKIGLTPNEEAVMDLPKHTEVIPHDDTMRMLALSGLNQSIKYDRQSNEIVTALHELKEAITNQDKSSIELHKTLSGFYQFKKESESFSKKIIKERYGSTLG